MFARSPTGDHPNVDPAPGSRAVCDDPGVLPGTLAAGLVLGALGWRTRRRLAWDDPMCALVLVAAAAMVLMAAGLLGDGRLLAALFLAVLTAPVAAVALEVARVPPARPVRRSGLVDWERFDAARETWGGAEPDPRGRSR